MAKETGIHICMYTCIYVLASSARFARALGPRGLGLVGRPGPLWAPMGHCGPVGWALVGPPGFLLGPCGPGPFGLGPYGPPGAFVGGALAGIPWALVGLCRGAHRMRETGPRAQHGAYVLDINIQRYFLYNIINEMLN